MNDMVLARLLEAHCIPIISYAIEVNHVRDRSDRRKLGVAYNSVHRKILDYNYNEISTQLQHYLGRPTWEELIEKRKSDFFYKLSQCPNDTLMRTLQML